LNDLQQMNKPLNWGFFIAKNITRVTIGVGVMFYSSLADALTFPSYKSFSFAKLDLR